MSMLDMKMDAVARPHIGVFKVRVFGVDLYLSSVASKWVAVDSTGDVYTYCDRPAQLSTGDWVGCWPRYIGSLDNLDDRFDNNKLFVIDDDVLVEV